LHDCIWQEGPETGPDGGVRVRREGPEQMRVPGWAETQQARRLCAGKRVNEMARRKQAVMGQEQKGPIAGAREPSDLLRTQKEKFLTSLN
jgi:hypothetical protein